MIYEYWEPRRNDIDRETQRTRRKTCPQCHFSTTNPQGLTRTWTRAFAVRGRPLTAWAKIRCCLSSSQLSYRVPVTLAVTGYRSGSSLEFFLFIDLIGSMPTELRCVFSAVNTLNKSIFNN
jgi:hypothetical protein